ncbi:MAG: imidazole glycerol phosphate synthase subunit HisH, partial [Deltaproteobacteria bacterium]
MISLLDYGAGNVRSVINAIKSLGHELRIITSPKDILEAERIVFPGVGNFGQIMANLTQKGYVEPLKTYLMDNRPFFGICLGLQVLFEGSEEAPGVPGLGIFKGMVRRFEIDFSVPHIGWNGIVPHKPSKIFADLKG